MESSCCREEAGQGRGGGWLGGGVAELAVGWAANETLQPIECTSPSIAVLQWQLTVKTIN